MKAQVTLGNPVLIFVYSLSLLLIGGAMGSRWHGQPTTVFSMALLGAALMVIHDTFSALIWIWLGARLLASAKSHSDREARD